MAQELESVINKAWDARSTLSSSTEGVVREVVDAALAGLDDGSFRVAEPAKSGTRSNKNWSKKDWPQKDWKVNQWLKKAVLLGFRLNPMQPISGGHGGAVWWDKVAPKFEGWTNTDFEKAELRTVPGAIVRHGAYIAPGVVLMPSFVNIGARVGAGTMVDTWASIGSCAQVGEHCHISAGAGIGGVLEPLQANPTIIEDNCFIGARSEVVEGMIVREGSVLAMGVFISQSTKIVDRQSGKITYGEIPPYSVIVPGALPDKNGGPSLACAVIVKTVDEKTRAKTGVNELLRG